MHVKQLVLENAEPRAGDRTISCSATRSVNKEQIAFEKLKVMATAAKLARAEISASKKVRPLCFFIEAETPAGTNP